jgi:hypothetical protein
MFAWVGATGSGVLEHPATSKAATSGKDRWIALTSDTSEQLRADCRGMSQARGEVIRASAREGFRIAGRGVLVMFDDEDLERYSTVEDLREVLAKAPELEGLVQVAEEAVAAYDPEREAVVLESRYEAVSVILVRETEVVTLGTLAFVEPS